MAITALTQGTRTCTIGTEHFETDINVSGKFYYGVDLVNAAAGDRFKVRMYQMELTSGTSRIVAEETYVGVQDAPNKMLGPVINELTDATAVRCSIQQTDGTGRAVPWKELKDDVASSSFPANFSTLVIDGSGRVDVSKVAGSAINALISGRVDASVGAVAANAIADAGLATDLDTYQAQIVLVKTALANHYTVIFYLNGQPITSGITSPTIQVIKASDGSDLVASTALTQIASTQTWKYDDSVNLVVAGSAYVAKVQATIDGATRTWEQPVGASA